ncbi:MAG: hypothetical protein PW786_14800 [Arachidicoccus sp.]|nr:hypothetical protein [Arachidicoccus sp.]
MSSLFKKRPSNEGNGIYNPFIKPGDLVYVTTKNGRFRVVEVTEQYFKAVPESKSAKNEPITFQWKEFKRWSSLS